MTRPKNNNRPDNDDDRVCIREGLCHDVEIWKYSMAIILEVQLSFFHHQEQEQ
jgi:hypothetical protein